MKVVCPRCGHEMEPEEIPDPEEEYVEVREAYQKWLKRYPELVDA